MPSLKSVNLVLSALSCIFSNKVIKKNSAATGGIKTPCPAEQGV
jgi:hypothetical protein